MKLTHSQKIQRHVLRRLFTIPEYLVRTCQRRLAAGQSPAKVARWLVEQPGSEALRNLAHNTLRQYLGILRQEIKRAMVIKAMLHPEPKMSEVQSACLSHPRQTGISALALYAYCVIIYALCVIALSH